MRDRPHKEIALQRISLLLVGSLVVFGCASSSHSHRVMFGLGTPNYMDDWQQLQSTLRDEDIRCKDGGSSLGTRWFWICSEDFGRAMRVAESAIRNHSLTVRIAIDVDSKAYEVYENGKRIRNEVYTAK